MASSKAKSKAVNGTPPRKGSFGGHRRSSSSLSATTTTTTTATTTTPTTTTATTPPKRSKYRHVAAYHSELRHSCLSREAQSVPSFLGFRNLMVIVLVAMNLRLVIENYMKVSCSRCNNTGQDQCMKWKLTNSSQYGVLICISCHDYRRQDVVFGIILFALVPCHLFVAYIIEVAAASQTKKTVARKKKNSARGTAVNDNDDDDDQNGHRVSRLTWLFTSFFHTINATLCLAITSFVVYYYIYHPGIGTICELHALIVWLKNCSYAFTNRDLRHAMLNPSADSELPELYASCPYPRNITIRNLTYFWMAPTLVYQPVYPRTARIRRSFVVKRLFEFFGLAVFMWVLSAQFASPVLQNSIEKIAVLDVASILERVMKLSTISLVIWLAGFFALFQSLLNALAEVMRFGDREFYMDWWNSPSLGVYWRTWNRPVYLFMKRHVYSPVLGRGWGHLIASTAVFTLSAILHEMLVGIPTHNFIGVAFVGMMFQLPLITMTVPLEKMKGASARVIGNSIFWVSFCLVGQPLGALLYFFAWQAKYGSVSKMDL